MVGIWRARAPRDRVAGLDEELGQIIGGKYQLGPVLGRGGMGVVREASHVRLGTKFAVKLMNRGADAIDRSRFEREALAASALNNRHVVQVFDVGETNRGEPYMVMERLRGRDAHAIFRENADQPVTRVIDWMIQVCSAMFEAHRAGIVHRDLKPSNVFIVDGPDELVKVVDFGISKVLSAEELTIGRAFVGTPQYMAPEQLRGEAFDHRADIWSMGVILYRLLSKRYPFPVMEAASPIVAALANLTSEPTPLEQHRPDLPAELVAAVMRALCKNADDRYADARELAQAIQPFGSGRVQFEEPGVDPGPASSLLERLQEGTPMFGSGTGSSRVDPVTLATHEITATPTPASPRTKAWWKLAVALAAAVVLAALGAVLLLPARHEEQLAVPPPPASASTPIEAPVPSLPALDAVASVTPSASPSASSKPVANTPARPKPTAPRAPAPAPTHPSSSTPTHL